MAFVLHRRPYRDTSLIVELLTYEHGMVGAVARGARRPRSSTRGVLQPFVPLCIAYVQPYELATLHAAEAETCLWLTGNALFCGFYLNELLLRLLQRGESCAQLFKLYQQTLIELAECAALEPVLRRFEWQLLQLLGYGLEISYDYTTNNPVMAEHYYQFKWEHGVRQVTDADNLQRSDVFAGRSLLAFVHNDWQEPHCLGDAKRLMRLALAVLLGDKPLKSRDLFG